MLYLTCTIIYSVDIADNGVSLAKDWVSVDCGTRLLISILVILDSINNKHTHIF